jgi:hypothetical protein
MSEQISPISVMLEQRFVNDGEIQENFFCCKELPKTSKSQDIFDVPYVVYCPYFLRC